jgi:hypothetical protein
MPNWGGGSTHGGDAIEDETAREEQAMPGWTGGSAHGGDAIEDETAQEEQPMPSWGGGSAHGGDATNEAKEVTETTDAVRAPTTEETIVPTSD